MPVRLPAFVLTAWLLAMLPGAGQALILRQTLTRGRRAAWASIAGTMTGLMIWTTLAAAGLSAVLLANPTAYLVIRVAGGLVLGWLGLNSLRAMLRHRAAPAGEAGPAAAEQQAAAPVAARAAEPAVQPAGEPAGGRGAYLAGLATNLGNPKAGVFAISLMPQFLPPDGHVLLGGLLLGVLWAVTSTGWYLLFVWLADHGRALLVRPAVTGWLHGLTGTVLLALGVAVVVSG